jgi:hypothetical protein
MPTLTAKELEHLLKILPDPTEANEPLSNLSFLQLFVPLGREQLSRLIRANLQGRGSTFLGE